MSKYESWKEFLCDQLCKEMEALKECTSYQNLKCVEKLVKTIQGLDEIEMSGAVKDFVEERYGYGGQGRTVRHAKYPDTTWGVYNDAGRGGMPNGMNGDMTGMPYNPSHEGMRTYDAYAPGRSGRMAGDASRSDRGMRGGNRNRGRGDMRGDSREKMRGYRTYDAYDGDDDDMYMVRQENGMPVVTPYNEFKKGMVPKKLTDEQCKDWVEGMSNADGTTGPHWNKEQAKQIQEKKGMQEIDPCAFWAALNASYSDLCEFFKKYGISTPDAYAEYTKAFWFDDEDAVGGGKGNSEKLAAYFYSVVEH